VIKALPARRSVRERFDSRPQVLALLSPASQLSGKLCASELICPALKIASGLIEDHFDMSANQLLGGSWTTLDES
jgi:hypothetical protein